MASIDSINFNWDNHSRCNYDGENLVLLITDPLNFATAMTYLEEEQKDMKYNPVYRVLREVFFGQVGKDFERHGQIPSSYSLELEERNGYVKEFLDAL